MFTTSFIFANRFSEDSTDCECLDFPFSNFEMFKDNNKETVLVTGCCGFLGSHLLRRIVKETDYNVIGIDMLSYCSNLKNIEDVERDFGRDDACRFVFVKCDFCDYPFLHSLFKTYRFAIVFHIGAYTHVDNSFDNSLDFTRNNTLGTHTLLEVARKFPVKKFVHMSTDEVYGSIPEGTEASEDYDFRPTNPYSISKVNAELLCKTYRDNYGLNIIIVRGNNIVGSCQFVEKLIPKFVTRLLRMQKCCIHGTGETYRNFTHVDDMTRAILLIANKSKPNETYNVGNVKKYSVKETTKLIIDSLRRISLQNCYASYLTVHQTAFLQQSYDNLIEYVPDRIFNDVRYDMDISKIERDLGFVPEYDFETSVYDIVLWYVKHQDYYSSNNVDKYIKPHSH